MDHSQRGFLLQRLNLLVHGENGQGGTSQSRWKSNSLHPTHVRKAHGLLCVLFAKARRHAHEFDRFF